jgi:hypothetical protein
MAMPKMKKNSQSPLPILIGLVMGFVLFGLLRFIAWQDNSTHYHANFAIFVNGQRDGLADPGFYEDVAPCSEDESDNPHHRAHLHDNVSDVIHVHAKGVTWGQFFENFGYSISDQHLKTAGQVFVNTNQQKVQFILNGKTLSNPAGLVIKSTDKLLVSYGPVGVDLTSQFNSVGSSAEQYNQQNDPASCKGQTSGGFKARWNNIWN